MATPLRTVPGSGGDPLAEAIELTRRLKLPHIRRSLTDIIPTAKAQRWDPAEVVRVLLAEEAAGRDRANLHTRRKRAGFPTGKTFGDWDETKSSIHAQALEQGWPIATGVVEGACRHLIADRFDITGSRWSVEGAEALLLLRAVIINGDFEEYWLHHIEQEHLRTRQARHQDGYALTT